MPFDALPVYHVITPGDHFSPRTGSAIPTVVDGLARAARAAGDSARYPQRVVVQEDTYQPRYDSADPVAYPGVSAPGMRRRLADVALGRLGLPRSGVRAYFRPAADVIRDRAPGIVLAHNAPALVPLVRDQAHRVVLYAHNDILRSYSRREAARALGGVAAVICVSDDLAAQVREQVPLSMRARVCTVVNGVDTEQFTPARQRAAGPVRVMFVGRMSADKGADILLAAAAQAKLSDTEYIIVGSHGFDSTAPLSPYERRLRALAESVAGDVRFQPFVGRDRMPQLLREADILVVPSRWREPLTLTVGEGLATGLPVVAARRGGIPQALGDAGMLFEPDRPAELAEVLTRLADDVGLRAELGAAARSRALAHDWGWAWGALRDVLDEVGGL
ncbi:hypothetical protein GCM10022240_00230 [Microbacterium kribbense]|uniref:Glycosyltransferase subfamily 4-like N-terminal domain-containing protein n=1 Tax=Microbacterium kribbense TaxID=433645 RepID=A0ABP7FYE5_9MICO